MNRNQNSNGKYVDEQDNVGDDVDGVDDADDDEMNEEEDGTGEM